CFKPKENASEGTLAATGFSNHAEDLAFANGQRHLVQGSQRLRSTDDAATHRIDVGKVTGLDNRRGHTVGTSCWSIGRWQNTCCPDAGVRLGGASLAQISIRFGQRDRNGQRWSS